MGNARKQIAMKMKTLEARCRERGYPVTVQRRVIFETLLHRSDHPTIDQVYEDVKNRISGVSRTTVYRTLETLAELGVAKKTSHFDAVARFDGNMDHHHHLVCMGCDKVVDFEVAGLKSIRLPVARHTGFDIVDFSIYFEGVCHECRKLRPKNQIRSASRSKRAMQKQ